MKKSAANPPLQMNLAFCQNHCASADFDQAFFFICFDVSQDYGRSVHLFTLDDLAGCLGADDVVQVEVVSQCTVGSACCGFFNYT